MENRRFNRPSREVSLIFVTLSVISFRDGFSIPYSSYTSNPLATPAPLWDPSCSSSASALLIPFGMISDRMKRRKIMAHGIAFVSAAISLVIARTEMNALLLAACI